MRKGMLYMHKSLERSAMSAAGYKRRDEADRNMLDLLPRLDEVLDSKSDLYDPQQVSHQQPGRTSFPYRASQGRQRTHPQIRQTLPHPR